jgi:two-component sensor histidine kinase
MIFRYDNQRDAIYFSHTPDQRELKTFEQYIHAIRKQLSLTGASDRWESTFRELTTGDQHFDQPVLFYSDIDERTFKCHLIPEYDAIGNIISIIGISQDITEIMNIVDTICKLQKEKEAIIAELHDRVNNNLQIVESLLRLQTGRLSAFNYDAIYENYSNRIHTISMVEKRLYHKENFEYVDFKAYIADYIETIQNKYSTAARNIQIQQSIQEVKVGISIAIPCALIINEIVLNSLQHAFPQGRSGLISIRMEYDALTREYSIETSDDGIGFPEHIDTHNPTTLGLELVDALVRQIKGTTVVSRMNGVKISLFFKA